MGLENLSSVFTEGIDYFNTNFPSSQTLEKDTFFFGGDQPDGRDSSLADLAKQSLQDRFVNSNTFGIFGGSNSQNPWGSDNFPYIQSQFQPSNTSWDHLYNEGHTPKNDIGYSYNSNVNRDNLKIRYGGDPTFKKSTASSRNSSLLSGGKEPYVVSDIGEGGRDINFGSREFPINRSITDVNRMTKFLSSPAGEKFILMQNFLGNQGKTIVNKNGELKTQTQYKSIYNPLSTLMASGPLSRFGGYGPNVLVDRIFPDFGILEEILGTPTKYGIRAIKSLDASPITQNISDVFGGGLSDGGNQIDNFFANLFSDGNSVTKHSSGDPQTLMDIKTDTKGLKDISPGTITGTDSGYTLEEVNRIEGTMDNPNGMPFYFKDLRDDSYVIFRAYIDGITENIAPSWNPTNYIGRSEPVYTYERAERDIGFNFKLFAQTKGELSMIYKKINKLTSLCYPEYHVDTDIDKDGNKTRMKPPLTKFRLGELFGASDSATQNRKSEMLGFIKSLTYTMPDEGVWETENGKRVPKYITVSIAYQVIHATVPNLETQFHGYIGD